MEDMINKMATWPFLNEPIYRWFMFFIACAGFSVAWNGVLAFMK